MALVRALLLIAGACLLAPASRSEDSARADYRGDLAIMRDEYVLKSRAFTTDGRRVALDLLASLEARSGDITSAEFLIAVAKIAALADNGHDGWYPGDGAWLPALRAPIRYFPFPDALVVAHAAPAQQDLIGARVTAIDALPMEEVFGRLRQLAGGPDRYRRWNVGIFLERAELLHALGIARAPDRYALSLVLRDGKAVTREVGMIPREQASRGTEPGRLLAGSPYGNEPELGWRGITGAPNEPLYLQDADRLFRYVNLPGQHAAYIQFRAHFGSDEEPIESFQSRALARLEAEKPANLVMDLRFDTGGDISMSTGFFSKLAAAVPGRIYVIISRFTFSAGIVAAALVEMSAPERVTLVGEPVGDRLRFWSEGHDVCLPGSKYCLHMRDGLWDLVNGCAQEPGCYGDQFKARVPDLDPDILAPISADAWLAGTDPAMSAIEKDLHGR
jgi:hypothetical protein